MVREVVTYKDFEGNDRTDVLYFNLTKAECMEMELAPEGGVDQMARDITETKDPMQIIRIVKRFLLASYCERTPDGRGIIKTPDRTAVFAASEAYSELFVSLAQDADRLARFFNGVLPFVAEGDKTASVTALPAADK